MIGFELKVFGTTQKYLSNFQWFEKVRAKKVNSWTRIRLWSLVIEWRKIPMLKSSTPGVVSDSGLGNLSAQEVQVPPGVSPTNETTEVQRD